MSSDSEYLRTITSALMANGGHRTYWDLVMNALANTAQQVSVNAAEVETYYVTSQTLYASMLSVSNGTMASGFDQMDVPLRNMLGAGAFLTMPQLGIRRPVTRNASYQIVSTDFFTDLILTTSGTQTYTLPAWADMPDYVPPLIGKNRSGNNLTLQRAGTDTMDNAATSVTVPTGSHWEVYKSDTAGTWETRVFA